jgi:DNA polymerase I-like protein with 3'-5' exonuclease and polymerase domains
MNLLDAYNLLHTGAITLAEVEERGICIDVEYCKDRIKWIDLKSKLSEHRFKQSKLYAAWIARFPKISYGSHPQLRAVLYADLKVKPFRKTEKDEDSVDEESLRQTNIDGIEDLLGMRRYKKIRDVLSQFLRYQVDGFLYPNFLLHTVATYRSSSSGPNMQNTPKRDKESMDICRKAIIPRKGYRLLEVDFSGLEVNIAACYHKDPVMIDYLNDPTSDMHADTALDLFLLKRKNTEVRKLANFGTLRQASKNGFVFPEFYGDYYESCAHNIAVSWCKLPRTGAWRDHHGIEFDGMPIARHFASQDIESLSDFADHVKKVEDDFWQRRFKVYAAWRKNWYSEYQKTGFFDMKTGFRCAGVMARNAVVNYPVQGAAFHVLLWCLIRMVERMRGWRSGVIGEIHDSGIIEAHPDEFDNVVSLVQQICTVEVMREWPWLIVPLKVEVMASKVDGNWAEMEEVHG